MKEFNHKEVSMHDLEDVNGGCKEMHVPDFPDRVCPICGFQGMDNFYEYIDGKRKDLIICLTCYHTFDQNEAGELVQFGRFLG